MSLNAWAPYSNAAHTAGTHGTCMRALNLKQLLALHTSLKKLPPPGKGEVVVASNNGKAVMTVKKSPGTAGAGKN